ncbi:methyltransferase domain-containing protein [Rickettsia sp. Tenjiku01]|nr:methyltransferase domain-containing protein [Rickettsia sp. Tenjiku01]
MLDVGCGVGRDTKYFLSQRYQVTAFDGSTEMVK